MPSSVCLARASKDLCDSRRLCHYRFCPKEALESTKTESSSKSLKTLKKCRKEADYKGELSISVQGQFHSVNFVLSQLHRMNITAVFNAHFLLIMFISFSFISFSFFCSVSSLCRWTNISSIYTQLLVQQHENTLRANKTSFQKQHMGLKMTTDGSYGCLWLQTGFSHIWDHLT